MVEETTQCNKCYCRCGQEAWGKGITYTGIDRHHNPPEFLSDFFKEEWSGEFYNLCRECHVELHRKIKKILNKHSSSFKFINSEYWTLMKMTPVTIRTAQKEIYSFTKRWIKKEDEL